MVRQPEKSIEVEVALDLVPELLDVDLFRGRVVGVANRVAEREGLKEQLDRVRAGLRGEEDQRLVADQLECARPFGGSVARMLELADLALRRGAPMIDCSEALLDREPVLVTGSRRPAFTLDGIVGCAARKEKGEALGYKVHGPRPRWVASSLLVSLRSLRWRHSRLR